MNKYFAAKTALIVDSNRADLGALRDIFGQFGLATVAVAPSANMASSYLQAQTFDFCIVAHDLGRGEKSGLQIVQEALLDGYRHRRTIFVLLAAAPQALQCAGLVDYAPDICLPKPLDRVRAQERLEKLVQLKRVLAPIDSLLEQGHWATALSEYEKLGERFPGLQGLLSRLRGQLLLRLGNFDAARDLFASLGVRQSQRWVTVGLGRALYGLGDYVKARQWLEREDEKTPLSPEVCLPLARSLRMEGQRPAALALLRKALIQNPAMAQLQAELGSMQGQSGDWDLATAAYREAVRYARFSPFQCVEYYCALVRALLSQIDGLGTERSVAAETEAVQTLENLLRDFQDDPATVVRAKLMSVEVYLASGNRQMADQAARDAFRRFEALELSEQLLLPDLLVDTLEQSCMADVAQTARREAIRQMSRLGWGRCNLAGMLSYRKGDFAAAYEQFCTADELCPGNPSIVLNLVQSGLELARSAPDQFQPLVCRCNDALSVIHFGALGNRQRERCRSLWLRLEALYGDHSEPGFVVLDED
uniref:tetratricopeptide repeat protein n=1 Tax=Marinobacterium profundum TaxID=1714300 RepID=UPI00082C30FA|nr:tetratricopeptide repeat protein [Marinobacterium profundum]